MAYDVYEILQWAVKMISSIEGITSVDCGFEFRKDTKKTDVQWSREEYAMFQNVVYKGRQIVGACNTQVRTDADHEVKKTIFLNNQVDFDSTIVQQKLIRPQHRGALMFHNFQNDQYTVRFWGLNWYETEIIFGYYDLEEKYPRDFNRRYKGKFYRKKVKKTAPPC